MNNINFSFTGKDISAFGGIKVVSEFFKKENIDELIKNNWICRKTSNNRHDETNIIKSIIMGIYAQSKNISNIASIIQQHMFQELSGSKKHSPATFSRFLNSLTHGLCVKIEDITHDITLRTLRLNPRKTVTIDLDSSVKTVYGNQEGSRVGYNPTKPGRKSYHMALAFVQETESFLHGTLRPGNSVSLTSISAFIEEVLSKMPKDTEKIKMRLDSGYFSKKLFADLIQRNIEFVTTARMTKKMRTIIGSIKSKDWERIDSKREITEVPYEVKHNGETYELRLIITREIISENTQGKRIADIPEYAFSAMVTNLEWQNKESIWQFRNGRSEIENRIKEIKEDFLQKLSCKNFWANQGIFLLSLLAYELFNLLRKKYFRTFKKKHQRFSTFFYKYILIAVRKVMPQRKIHYRLDESHPWQKEFCCLMKLLLN